MVSAENEISYRVTDRFGRVVTQNLSVFQTIGPVVRFSTELGFFDVELLNESAPLTTQNFLRYQAAGLYDRSIFHRSEVGVGGAFLVQGGGFSVEDGTVAQIEQFEPVVNEFSQSNSNLRGTIAAAFPEGNPNGATSEWFINLNDANSALDEEMLTVFGNILGNGIEVAEQINQLPTSQVGPVINQPSLGNFETPLQDFVEFSTELTGSVSGDEASNVIVGTTSIGVDLSVGQQIRLAGNEFTVDEIISDDSVRLDQTLAQDIENESVFVNSSPSESNYVVVESVSLLTFE